LGNPRRDYLLVEKGYDFKHFNRIFYIYNMAKLAFKMKLKRDQKAEYKRRHAAIWPELVKLLHENGVSDYYIFLDEETSLLFAVQNQSGEKSSQDLGTNPIVQKWWNYMADIMETNPDNSPVSVPLEEVFYME
jgi:L-rhamnose mutarotase